MGPHEPGRAVRELRVTSRSENRPLPEAVDEPLVCFRDCTKATELNLPVLALILGVLLLLAGAFLTWPLIVAGVALAVSGGVLLVRRWESLRSAPMLAIHGDRLLWQEGDYSFADIRAVRRLLLEGSRGFERPKGAMFVEFNDGATLLIDPQMANWGRAQDTILARVPAELIHIEGAR